MSDVAVTLPDPSPEDDEDVVWGLSTATALWARGERGDAIVWLRRAADAAESAGQEPRGTQRRMATGGLEQEAQRLDVTPEPPGATAITEAPIIEDRLSLDRMSITP